MNTKDEFDETKFGVWHDRHSPPPCKTTSDHLCFQLPLQLQICFPKLAIDRYSSTPREQQQQEAQKRNYEIKPQRWW